MSYDPEQRYKNNFKTLWTNIKQGEPASGLDSIHETLIFATRISDGWDNSSHIIDLNKLELELLLGEIREIGSSLLNISDNIQRLRTRYREMEEAAATILRAKES